MGRYQIFALCFDIEHFIREVIAILRPVRIEFVCTALNKRMRLGLWIEGLNIDIAHPFSLRCVGNLMAVRRESGLGIPARSKRQPCVSAPGRINKPDILKLSFEGIDGNPCLIVGKRYRTDLSSC